MKHIGIVAVSSPGAALCFQTICTEGEKFTGVRYHHPEISLHCFSFKEYVDALYRNDLEKIEKLLVMSIEKLEKLGVDFVICPDNTVHIVYDNVIKKIRVPWLHIADAVASEIVRRNYRKVLIIGTKFLMESNVYPSRLKNFNIEYVIPDKDDREIINNIIFDELVYGIIREESKWKLIEIIEKYQKEEKCDAVILGCTELPLIITEKESPIPILNSTRILVRKAVE